LENIEFNWYYETVPYEQFYLLTQAMQVVEDLRAVTHELLDENDWVDKETKRLVMEKTDAMLVLAGFPDWVSNISALDLYYDKV
jgi:predicted metalloendopeptidase